MASCESVRACLDGPTAPLTTIRVRGTIIPGTGIKAMENPTAPLTTAVRNIIWLAAGRAGLRKKQKELKQHSVPGASDGGLGRV